MPWIQRSAFSLLTALFLSSYVMAQAVPPSAQAGSNDYAGRGLGPGYDRSGRKIVLAWADVRNTGASGLQHDSVSHAIATIERLGYESGVYDTYIRTDSNVISKHPVDTHGKPITKGSLNLDQIDAIFFIGLREIDLDAQQKKDLMAFIKEDGKGFVAAHAADTAFMDWPEFGDMLGGWFDQHPWGYIQAPVIVEDPNFPAVKHLRPVFNLTDEYYQTKNFSREKSHVVLRLDTSKLPMNQNVHRTDGDFPLAWAKMHGKGRVFYCALGHDVQSWDNPDVYRIYFEAIKWALGLTNADITPRPFPGLKK
jgi:type 1 glutamine amidotransferase